MDFVSDERKTTSSSYTAHFTHYICTVGKVQYITLKVERKHGTQGGADGVWLRLHTRVEQTLLFDILVTDNSVSSYCEIL